MIDNTQHERVLYSLYDVCRGKEEKKERKKSPESVLVKMFTPLSREARVHALGAVFQATMSPRRCTAVRARNERFCRRQFDDDFAGSQRPPGSRRHATANGLIRGVNITRAMPFAIETVSGAFRSRMGFGGRTGGYPPSLNLARLTHGQILAGRFLSLAERERAAP